MDNASRALEARSSALARRDRDSDPRDGALQSGLEAWDLPTGIPYVPALAVLDTPAVKEHLSQVLRMGTSLLRRVMDADIDTYCGYMHYFSDAHTAQQLVACLRFDAEYIIAFEAERGRTCSATEVISNRLDYLIPEFAEVGKFYIEVSNYRWLRQRHQRMLDQYSRTEAFDIEAVEDAADDSLRQIIRERADEQVSSTLTVTQRALRLAQVSEETLRRQSEGFYNTVILGRTWHDGKRVPYTQYALCNYNQQSHPDQYRPFTPGMYGWLERKIPEWFRDPKVDVITEQTGQMDVMYAHVLHEIAFPGENARDDDTAFEH